MDNSKPKGAGPLLPRSALYQLNQYKPKLQRPPLEVLSTHHSHPEVPLPMYHPNDADDNRSQEIVWGQEGAICLGSPPLHSRPSSRLEWKIGPDPWQGGPIIPPIDYSEGLYIRPNRVNGFMDVRVHSQEDLCRPLPAFANEITFDSDGLWHMIFYSQVQAVKIPQDWTINKVSSKEGTVVWEQKQVKSNRFIRFYLKDISKASSQLTVDGQPASFEIRVQFLPVPAYLHIQMQDDSDVFPPKDRQFVIGASGRRSVSVCMLSQNTFFMSPIHRHLSPDNPHETIPLPGSSLYAGEDIAIKISSDESILERREQILTIQSPHRLPIWPPLIRWQDSTSFVELTVLEKNVQSSDLEIQLPEELRNTKIHYPDRLRIQLQFDEHAKVNSTLKPIVVVNRREKSFFAIPFLFPIQG